MPVRLGTEPRPVDEVKRSPEDIGMLFSLEKMVKALGDGDAVAGESARSPRCSGTSSACTWTLDDACSRRAAYA